MLENTLSVLEAHAPGMRALIPHAELLMPYDIEARYGMVGGNWHHGELAVEQMLFLRPLREAAQYATPLPGLWLAGAGSHPGGGITGAAGWNAAEDIQGGHDGPLPLQNPAEADAVSCPHRPAEPPEQLGALGGLYYRPLLWRHGDGTYGDPQRRLAL